MSRRVRDDGVRLAGGAALVVLASLFLPWYEKSVIPTGQRTFATANLSAFGTFTWIEAAILVVDVALLVLVWARWTRRPLELPASDGGIVIGGGAWIGVLLLIRVFDRPDVTGTAASVGLQWGLLVAMAGTGAIIAAGVTLRAAAGHPPRRPRMPRRERPDRAADAPAAEATEIPPRWRRPRT